MNRTVTSIFVLLAFCLLPSGNLSAQLLGKKGNAFDVSGKVLGLEGEGVGDVEVILYNADGKEVGSETTKKRIGKGNFKFSKIPSGTYTLFARSDVGEASQEGVVDDDDVEVELTLGSEPAEEKKQVAKGQAVAEGESIPDRMPQEEYVMTEISFEMKKMAHQK